jgi:hypothetical protein
MKENVKKINRTFDIPQNLCWQHWEKTICIYNVFRGTTAQEMDHIIVLIVYGHITYMLLLLTRK